MNEIKYTINMKNTILVALFSLLLVACGSKDPKAQLEKLKKQKSDIEAQIATLEAELAKSDTSSAEVKSTEVGVMALSSQVFKTYIEIQGRVDADESVSLSSEMPGTITKINVKPGDQVSKGQVLAETDARALQQQLATAQVSLGLFTQMYDKQKSLWEQKIGTELQYLQTKAMKEGVETSIGTLQEQIRMTKIVSPIDGTVDALNIKLGQAIQPGIPAINIVNFSKLKVKADVAESYTSRVKNGNEVLIQFPDMKDSVIAKVDYASRAINATSRTFGVEVWLDNRKEYHPNMVAKLKINDYQSAKPIVAIPVKYIQKSSEGNYVLVAENGKAVKKTLTLGREYNGMAEVLAGVNEGDQLITMGYDLVLEGDAVSFKK